MIRIPLLVSLVIELYTPWGVYGEVYPLFGVDIEKVKFHTVSVLGLDLGYTVKYSPLAEGTPEGEGVYFIVYPELSPNTDIL